MTSVAEAGKLPHCLSVGDRVVENDYPQEANF